MKDILKDINNFATNNKIFIPSDDEGNSYNLVDNLELQVRYVTNRDYERSRLEDTYSEEDLKTDDENFDDYKKVFVLYYN